MKKLLIIFSFVMCIVTSSTVVCFCDCGDIDLSRQSRLDAIHESNISSIKCRTDSKLEAESCANYDLWQPYCADKDNSTTCSNIEMKCNNAKIQKNNSCFDFTTDFSEISVTTIDYNNDLNDCIHDAIDRNDLIANGVNPSDINEIIEAAIVTERAIAATKQEYSRIIEKEKNGKELTEEEKKKKKEHEQLVAQQQALQSKIDTLISKKTMEQQMAKAIVDMVKSFEQALGGLNAALKQVVYRIYGVSTQMVQFGKNELPVIETVTYNIPKVGDSIHIKVKIRGSVQKDLPEVALDCENGWRHCGGNLEYAEDGNPEQREQRGILFAGAYYYLDGVLDVTDETDVRNMYLEYNETSREWEGTISWLSIAGDRIRKDQNLTFAIFALDDRGYYVTEDLFPNNDGDYQYEKGSWGAAALPTTRFTCGQNGYQQCYDLFGFADSTSGLTNFDEEHGVAEPDIIDMTGMSVKGMGGRLIFKLRLKDVKLPSSNEHIRLFDVILVNTAIDKDPMDYHYEGTKIIHFAPDLKSRLNGFLGEYSNMVIDGGCLTDPEKRYVMEFGDECFVSHNCEGDSTCQSCDDCPIEQVCDESWNYFDRNCSEATSQTCLDNCSEDCESSNPANSTSCREECCHDERECNFWSCTTEEEVCDNSCITECEDAKVNADNANRCHVTNVCDDTFNCIMDLGSGERTVGGTLWFEQLFDTDQLYFEVKKTIGDTIQTGQTIDENNFLFESGDGAKPVSIYVVSQLLDIFNGSLISDYLGAINYYPRAHQLSFQQGEPLAPDPIAVICNGDVDGRGGNYINCKDSMSTDDFSTTDRCFLMWDPTVSDAERFFLYKSDTDDRDAVEILNPTAVLEFDDFEPSIPNDPNSVLVSYLDADLPRDGKTHYYFIAASRPDAITARDKWKLSACVTNYVPTGAVQTPSECEN